MGSISLIKAAGFARDDESAVHFASDESKSEEITSLISHPEKIQIGNQADLKDAVNWFRGGAEQGNDEKAQLILGTMLLTGVGVQKDLSQAARMFQLASTKMPAAQAILGQFYFEGTGLKQDFHEAARRLREAAEKGVDISFWMLGYLYMEGLGVVQDLAEAAKWFRKGLAQGDCAAKAYLGMLHLIGKGVPQDFSKAYKLAREAAEQGNQVGQYLIGMIFFSGKGVAQNSGECLKWMQAAARQGESHADVSELPEAQGVLRRLEELDVGGGEAPDHDEPLDEIATAPARSRFDTRGRATKDDDGTVGSSWPPPNPATPLHRVWRPPVPKPHPDDLQISTFHSLGVRILREEAKALGYKPRSSIFDSADYAGIIGDCAKTVDKATLRILESIISNWKNALVTPEAARHLVRDEHENLAAHAYLRDHGPAP